MASRPVEARPALSPGVKKETYAETLRPSGPLTRDEVVALLRIADDAPQRKSYSGWAPIRVTWHTNKTDQDLTPDDVATIEELDAVFMIHGLWHYADESKLSIQIGGDHSIRLSGGAPGTHARVRHVAVTNYVRSSPVKPLKPFSWYGLPELPLAMAASAGALVLPWMGYPQFGLTLTVSAWLLIGVAAFRTWWLRLRRGFGAPWLVLRRSDMLHQASWFWPLITVLAAIVSPLLVAVVQSMLQ